VGQLLKFSLEDHMVECEDRYQHVVERLDVIDNRLTKIEQLILELKVLVVKN
jgi:hypothetical protein